MSKVTTRAPKVLRLNHTGAFAYLEEVGLEQLLPHTV